MGLGGMLAGGCAVGAGVIGGAVMTVTAWAVLLLTRLAAGIADRLLDYQFEEQGSLYQRSGIGRGRPS